MIVVYRTMKNLKYLYTLITISALILHACKEDEDVFEDPYSGGKAPLGVTISRDQVPSPSHGMEGAEVTIQARGLVEYKDQIVFMFNGQEAQVTEVTDSHIKVKVPEFASSGVTSVAIGDQIVIGPKFKVDGKINVDPTFRATHGANGVTSQFFPLPDGRFILVGGFTNYDDKGLVTPMGRIVRVSADGDLDRSFRTLGGANGQLVSVALLGDKLVVSGGFSGYGQRTSNISNITVLNSNGSVDTMAVHPYRRPGQQDTTIYMPKFNGGADGGVRRVYNVSGKILATGNFRYYVSRRYDQPNYTERRDTVILDSTEIRQIFRLEPDGKLDKTFRFDQSGKAFAGANGYIDTYMHADGANEGKLLVFGKFSTFDGTPAPNILRLNPDGSRDPSFNPGKGTDNEIYSATYNATLHKYVLTGSFKTYDGRSSEGMVVLNLDGSVDASFSPKGFGGSFPTYAKQLNDGMIVVAGGFRTYNGIVRNGFMMLTPSGDLARGGYNATGIFSGSLVDVVETTSADGKRALLLLGSFSRFDGEEISNITRVTIE